MQDRQEALLKPKKSKGLEEDNFRLLFHTLCLPLPWNTHLHLSPQSAPS